MIQNSKTKQAYSIFEQEDISGYTKELVCCIGIFFSPAVWLLSLVS